MGENQRLYLQKLTSAEKIAEQIESGWTIGTDLATGIPTGIMHCVGELAEAGAFDGVTLHTMLHLTPFMKITEQSAAHLRIVTWFSSGNLSQAVNQGYADVMPCYYRDMPSLFNQYVDVDAYFIETAPMDKDGYFCTAASGSINEVMLKKAKRVYVEVNRKAPVSSGSPRIHISNVTALCENDVMLPVFPPVVVDDISKQIGTLIASEVPDGATLQIGIGAVPEAVSLSLKNKKDLGIHTELFTDSMVELIECGAVTNCRKPIYRGKSVATLAFGSERLYRYIDKNLNFLMLPVDEVNDPRVIAMHPNFISVNAALEVDFFGQVCAESMGIRHVSGSGGQADYVRGAVLSKGGKSFIAFPSTAKNGTISRIQPILSPGAIVTTSKNDVDYIVTEYGMAKLRGKTLSERTKALIGIAHPKFRDELLYAARKRNILI